MSEIQRRLSSWRLWLIASVVIAAALQFADLGGKSLWDDEVTTVTIARNDSVEDVYTAYRASERQPPLHYLLLHGWTRLAGSSDWAVRVPSALFSIASVLLLGWIGVRVAGRRVGLLAAYLLAISPSLLLFGTMARYYAQALFLVLLSTALLVEAILRPQRSNRTRAVWLVYVVASVAMLLTSYTNAAFFVAQVVLVVFLLGSAWTPSASRFDRAQNEDSEPADTRLARRRAVFALGAVMIAFALWIAVDFSRLADFAASDRQSAIGGWKEAVLAAVYPFYAWTLGGTIFPWHPAALVALAVILPAGAIGLVRLARSRPLGLVPIVALATSVVLTLVSFQFFIRDLPFETLANRAIGGMPFLLLVVAAGLASLRRRARVAALVALTGAACFANLHYFQGRQFHNAAYALPTKEVMATVVELGRATDVVISDPDLPLYYYYRDAAPSSPKFFFSSEGSAARKALEDSNRHRVWVLTAGRDSTREWRDAWGATKLDAWIKRHFRLERTWRYVPQDALYARIKARTQGFPSYRYKLTLLRYTRRDA